VVSVCSQCEDILFTDTAVGESASAEKMLVFEQRETRI